MSKKQKQPKKLIAILLSLIMVTSLFSGMSLTAHAEAKEWTYNITTGGEYTCPATLTNYVVISGGTKDNPVIININGSVDAAIKNSINPFCVKNGYVKIVGTNNASFSGYGFVACSNTASGSSKPNGDANIDIRDVVVNTKTGGSLNVLQYYTSTTTCTGYFENVTFRNFNRSNSGALILWTNSKQTFKNCTFENNAGAATGAISISSGADVTMEGCTFTNCTATGSSGRYGGGAIEVRSTSKLTLDDCTFQNCTSPCGAVGFEKTATLTLKGNTQITGNTSGNLYLPTGATFKVAEDFTGTVGVTTQTAPTESASVALSNDLADTQAALANNNIVSDNDAYSVKYKNNSLSLIYGKEYTVPISPENSGTVEVVEDGDNLKFTATPASGYEFDCWKANNDGDFDTVSDNNPFIVDKNSFSNMSNLTAVFKEAAAPAAYAQYNNTTTVIKFDDKDWYLIDYDDDTVTLLAKECVGASVFDGNESTSYSGSTIETFVNNWYSDNVTADAKSAVSGGMFLLEADTANGLIEDVLKCSWENYYGDNLWWLSTPVEAGENDRYVAFVKDGVVKADGSGMSVYVELGVRPALKLDLSKVEFDSETKTFALPAPAEDGPLVGTVIKVGDTLTLDGDYIEVMPGVIEQVTDSLKLERMKYDDYFNGWGAVFEEAYAFLIAGDETPEPDGFYVSGGNGTQSHPYTLALHYASSAYAGYVPAEADDATALAAKVVKFNGYDWYLIEDNSTSATEGTVTLFAKDTIGSSRFDNSKNEYSGSMVKSYLDNLTAEGGAFADVADAIVSTDLEDVTVTGAKLWLLSKDEVITTYKLSTALNKCSNDWWLRTPTTSSYVIYVNGTSGSVVNAGNFHMNTYGVRPALQLDLSKVEFDSSSKTFALPQPLVEYPLWLGGVQVTNKNASNIDGNNKASYDAETNTLTLNGYTNSGTARADIQSGVNNAAIYYNDNMFSPNPLTIQLAEGTTNSLTMTGDRIYGIYVFGSAMTITGNGTLNVQSEDMAINDAWGVAITGGTVNAASSSYYGINSVTIGADISSVTITGELGAIYGGSNEEQELINAIAGTGWTDTAGTTGKAYIAISTTGQNVSSYKKVYFTPHTHNFTYSADGATITATCNADGCPLTDNKATLTIAAPNNLTYNTNAKAAVITDANAIQGTAKVQYQTKNGSTYGEATEIAPAGVGSHKASITVGGATASVEYTIAKADPTYTVPTDLKATYGDTLSSVTLPTGWSWANGSQKVGNVGTNTFKANFTPTDTANYNVVENVDVTVKVSKASQTAPAAPTEAGKTINSITLNTIPNGEYKCGDGAWQTSPTFTGLAQNTTYVFRQRYAADANHNASAGSEETVIRTANHTHSFTYSSSNGTITATCNGAGTCNLTDNKVSFTLVAPVAGESGLVYDGTDKKATLEGVEAFNAATGMNVSADDIVYNYKAKNSDSSVVVTETKNAGIYQALYTLQTDFPRPVVGISFTIAKADPTYEAPTGLYADYGDTLADVALPEGWAWVNGSQSVGNAGTNTFKAKFTPADTTNYNVVENVDVTVKVNKADITPTVTLDGWTYGDEANTPSVTGNAGDGDVAYTYAQKGSDEFSSAVPTDAGDYTVKAVIAQTANYNGGEATADFTIAKAKVTVTADDKTSKREAALKELTYKVDGKVADGDDLGIKVTSNVKAAVAGKYEIIVTYTENANYDVTVVDGTYTVIDRITKTEKANGKNKINSAVKATVNKDGSITAKWGAVANAEKYEVYASYCGSKYKMIKSVKGNVLSFNITKLNGKKINQKKCVKIYVVAYRMVNGKYEKITQTISLHIAGKENSKHSNAKAIKVNKQEFSLKVNKTATIKPTIVLNNSKKKAIEHTAKFRYQSTNKAVATVDENGKITAVGKGTCTIYIFANNGKLNAVKVTVK